MTPLVLDGVDADTYTLIVTNTVLGCSSLPVDALVKDDPATIDIVITENTPSTSCSPTHNGVLAAAVDTGGPIVTAGYTFEWFVGTDISATGTNTNTDGNDYRAIELLGGAGQQFTVKVTDDLTGCFNSFTIVLADASVLPTATLAPTANNVCDPLIGYTGVVTATVTDPNGSLDFINDYTFNWTNSLGNPVIDADLLTPLTLNGVNADTYTLVLTNDVLGCNSTPVSVGVTDNPAVITIGNTNTPSTNCIADTDPNGQIVADTWVDLDGDAVRNAGVEDLPGLFTYQWHTGTDTTTPIVGEISPTISTIQGGAGRNYTIEVTHIATGCAQTYTVLLNDASELPVVTMVTTANSGCAPGLYTGTATATIMYKGVDVTASPDYTFAWTGPNVYSSATPITVTGLENGNYTLTVTNTVLTCVSLPYTTAVIDNPAVITIGNTNTPSTNCIADTDPNGQIVADTWVDLDGDAVRNAGVEDLPGLFTYQWHTGTDTTTPIVGEISPTISTIQGGAGRNYTIEVTHIATGCAQTYTVLLNDASELPIVALTPTDNKGCTVGNYTGTVTALVTYQGVDVTASPDYSFAWTSTDGLFASVNAATIANLKGSETYTLTATNTVLSCVAVDVTITVDDNPDPIVIFYGNTPNTSCAATGNGELIAGVDTNGNGTYEVGVDDLLANLGDYNFTWHVG